MHVLPIADLAIAVDHAGLRKSNATGACTISLLFKGMMACVPMGESSEVMICFL